MLCTHARYALTRSLSHTLKSNILWFLIDLKANHAVDQSQLLLPVSAIA